MPEINKSFTRGSMDLGTDARLMQEGFYRALYNGAVVGSESSDKGVIQNIRGNTSRGRGFTEVREDDPITIGTATNGTNDKIYYFWVSRNAEGIYEYDTSVVDSVTGGGTISRILEFTKNDVDSASFLNFDPNSPITGAVVVDDLLIWTDGVNPIRKINIERFKGSGVFKRCPNDENGKQVCPTGAITPEGQDDDTAIKMYLVSSPDPSHDGLGRELVSLSNDNAELDDALYSNSAFAGDLINLAKRPPLFPPTITKIVDGIDDNDYESRGAKAEDKLFDTMPRFAIRYRYTDGETSAISPFSAPAFIPRKYSINSDTGIMESMTNYLDKVDISFDIGEQEVKEIDIVYKESDSSAIYLVDTIKKTDTYVDGGGDVVEETESGAKSLQSISSSAVKRTEFKYEYDGSKVYRVLPSTELARIYDNVPIRAKALDMAGNRLVLGNFQENYRLTRRGENGEEIKPRFDVGVNYFQRESENLVPFRTCKTGRDYQLGLVYLDREGRQSPVIVANNNTVHIPYNEAGSRAKLKMTIKHEAPYWATHYRPFIKQNKGVFYNIIPAYSKFLYQATDPSDSNKQITYNQYFLRINDADINKAAVGDVLVLKKTNRALPSAEPEYWRVVETKRFLPSNSTTFEDNLLPGSIPDSEAGYFLVLAPVDGEQNALVEGIKNFPLDTETTLDETVWETIPADNVGDFYWEGFETYRCFNGRHTNANVEIPRSDSKIQLLDSEGRPQDGENGQIEIEINWHNAFGYSNRVEAMVVEDRFNSAALDQGARASTVVEDYDPYEKQSWLIHSGVYIDSTGLNRLNEFNVSLPLQKDLDVNDGSIQKIHFRDTNLYVFQERKVKNVPINKNVIVTADGGGLTTAGSQFFGTERAYAGEYGIAKNPESFATYGSRIYFADKNKGAILRLANDGITEISKNGVEAYVRKYISEAHFIKLFYNDYADELDISFQNKYELPEFESNRRIRRLSVQWGAPDDICRARIEELDFEDFYVVMHNPGELESNTGDFVIGDRVYVDKDRKVPFNGEYEHYRVQKGSNASGTFDQAIQISRDGVVTNVVESCSASFGFQEHKSFTVSAESFQSEVDACANAIVDQIAFFGPGTDQDYFDLSKEPQEGNFIYETPRTLKRSDRSGWFKINISELGDNDTLVYTNYVILIRNGVVIKVFDCARVEKGRVKFVGSDLLIHASDETSFDRNIRICTAKITDSWWIDTDRPEPLIGDIVYENNFTDDIPEAGYIHLNGGTYISIDDNAAVTDVASCAETICSNEPYKYLIPDTNVPFVGDINISYVSASDNNLTFDIDTALTELKLNDYISEGAIANDVDGDAKALEDQDLLIVKISETKDGSTSNYTLKARYYISGTDETLVVDDGNGLFVPDSEATHKIVEIDNLYKYKFLGVDAEDGTKIGLPSLTVKWFEKGLKTYPKIGAYETDIEPYDDDYGVQMNLKYRIRNEQEIAVISVESVLTEICYDKVTGGNEVLVYITTASFSTEPVNSAASPCETSTGNTVYYDPEVFPKKYYNENSLTTVFDGGDNYWGIAYSSTSNTETNAVVTHIEKINSSGEAEMSKTINCAYHDTIDLAFLPYDEEIDYADPFGQVCMLYDSNDYESYFANNSDWDISGVDNYAADDISKITKRDGRNGIAPDGWYATDAYARRMIGGQLDLGDDNIKACPAQYGPAVSLNYSAASGKEACSGTATDVFTSTKNTNLSNIILLYADQYGATYAPSGFYSNGTNTGEWNKQTGEFKVASCVNNNNVDYSGDDIPDTDNSPPRVPPTYNQRYSLFYGSTADAACESTGSQRYYSSSADALDGDLTTDPYGNNQAPSRFYRSGTVVREYQGNGTWGAESTCTVVPAQTYEKITLTFGGVNAIPGYEACHNGTTGSPWVYEGSSFGTGLKMFSNSNGTGEFSVSGKGFVSDGTRYAPYSGGVVGSTLSCPTKINFQDTYGLNLRYGSTSNNACASSSTVQRYGDESTLANSTKLYFDAGGLLPAPDYYYSDGSYWKYFSDGNAGKSGSCTEYYLQVGGSNQGTHYVTNVTGGSGSITGDVVVNTPTAKTIWVSATARLKNCPAGSNLAVGASTAQLQFDGSYGTQATLACSGGSQVGGSSVYKYNATSGGKFTVTVTNDDWNALGAQVEITLTLTVS